MNLDEQGRKRLRSGGALLLLLAFLLLLIPVLALSCYARGSADDYCFGIYTYHALQNGESLLAAVWRTVSGYYQSWQGSFAAVGMMSLTPCIWGETAYGITAVVMLASLIAGTVKLTDTLVRRLAGGDWRDVIYISIPMLLCSIQFMPSPLNSVYWWNGAVYYTFFYGLSLFYAERFAALLFLPRSNRAAILVPGLLCGILVGGSNYVSALLSALLGGLFWLYAMWKKRARWSAFLLLCGEAIPFFVSMAAPGNRIRQDTIASTPPVQAIWEAIGQAAADLTEWPNWPILLMLLAWLPLLWRLCGKSGFSFPLRGGGLSPLRGPEYPPFLCRLQRRTPAPAGHRLFFLLLALSPVRVVLCGLAPAVFEANPSVPQAAALDGKNSGGGAGAAGGILPVFLRYHRLYRRLPAGAEQRRGGGLRRGAGRAPCGADGPGGFRPRLSGHSVPSHPALSAGYHPRPLRLEKPCDGHVLGERLGVHRGSEWLKMSTSELV